MIAFDVRLEPEPRLPRRAAEQLPFALSKALNDTAKEFQEVERRHVKNDFQLRREQFILRTIKIERGDFATKRKLAVRVQVDPRRDYLAKFERGGRKRPQGTFLAVPVAARRTKSGIVSKRQRLDAFQFRGSGTVLLGEQRTFMIRTGPNPGIYQRVGRGSSSRVRMLYALKSSVPLPASLDFEENARAVVRRSFERHFAEAFRFAMATAR